MKCPTCHGEMLQKNRGVLFGVGLAMLATPALTLISPYFWPPAIVFVLIGAYLLIWATRGKGLWCRACKKFNLF
jgi:hypothetical protein